MRKLLALVAVAAIAFGVMGASAAYLGDMTSATLGATGAQVSSCMNSPLSTTYDVGWIMDDEGVYDYYVNSVTVDGIQPECYTDTRWPFRLTLSNDMGDVYVEMVDSIYTHMNMDTGEMTVPVASAGHFILAEDVYYVSIVLTDQPLPSAPV